MNTRNEHHGPMPDTDFDKEIETECSDLQDVLKSFRDAHRHAAERSAFYWKSRYGAILKEIRTPAASIKFRHPLLWAPAAVALLFCLIFFSLDRKPPVPDIAAGYDQELLIEVERALNRNCPAALEPLDILAGEMEP